MGKGNFGIMRNILSECSNPKYVIVNLHDNVVEIAPFKPNNLGLTKSDCNQILRHCNKPHAILAIDTENGVVNVIDCVDELPIASAVLLCMLNETTQLVTNRSCIETPMSYEDELFSDENYDEEDYDEEGYKEDTYESSFNTRNVTNVVAARDERGRFVSTKKGNGNAIDDLFQSSIFD